MGIEIHLCWKENGAEKWLYAFKLSSYPYMLQDYTIPDNSLPYELDSKYLVDYIEWLKKLQFFIKFAPEIYMKFNVTSNNLDGLKEGLLDDIINVQEAINKSKLLNLKKIKNWISVG